MSSAANANPVQPKPLRLWPAVAIVVLQWLGRFVIPIFAPDMLMYGVMGGLLGGILILLWWAFFSRAPIAERLIALGVIIAAVLATPMILHESIGTGNMGFMFPLFVTPVLCLAFVAWAVVSRSLSPSMRRATMVAAIVLPCLVWALFRTGGNTTDFDHDFAWRWSPTAEDRLLAMDQDLPATAPAATSPTATEPPATELTATAPSDLAPTATAPSDLAPSDLAPSDLASSDLASSDLAPSDLSPSLAAIDLAAQWPGFRGAARDSIIRGVRIATDWSAQPPTELWRRPIGPGWSSFAVHGDLVYTQEQRGEEELVSCYNAATGEPVWMHRDQARFWESVGGAGPRSTPTLSGGRVYTLGGTGIVNVLDARDGSLIWSRNAAEDTGAEVPMWGFSGSPLVRDDLVIVAASGTLIAYDLATGEPRWTGPAGGEGYSSPQLFTLDGVEQIVQLNGDALVGVEPTDGSQLWQHEWSGYPIVQPAVTDDGDLLISVNSDSGTRRVDVERGPDGWTTTERWTSRGLKSYFNDFVIHHGHAYGFDGTILSCIDVADGERQWKGGRYGGGQLFLLADQDLLLVLSEKGELALVRANTDGFEELAKMPAIKGKTWNHPVLVDDLLLVRNGEEMVAFRLPLAGA